MEVWLMRKIVIVLFIVCALLGQYAMAQVFEDFEVEAAGVSGFYDNAWGTGLSSIERIADPTSTSDGVLALNCDASLGEKGVIQIDNLDSKNAERIDVNVWLPADFPDGGQVTFWAQDNVRWAGWNATDHAGSSLAKEEWITLSFNMRELADANPTEFYPYDGAILGKFGMQVFFGDATWTGQVLVDNFSLDILPANKSWVMVDFENEDLGLAGFSKGWGEAFIDLYWFPDETERSAGIMEFEVDFIDDIKAAFQKESIDILWTDSDTGAIAFSFDIFLPDDFPTTAIIKVWAQDGQNWTWTDYKYNVNGSGGDSVAVDEWDTITFDILAAMSNPDFDPKAGIKCGVELYDDSGDGWAGFVHFDNFTLIGVSPPEATLASPQVSAVLSDSSDDENGSRQYVNRIEWQDLEGSAGESYNVYAAASAITDAMADGVIKIATEIPRGVGFYNHEIYGAADIASEFYYALTTSGIDAGQIIETPVLDGVSNTGMVSNGTTIAPVIPLVESFDFIADGDLSEFAQFADAVLVPERIGGPAADDWTQDSQDANFSGWLVMDSENFYVGFDVIDDSPDWGTQAWEGDGFDVFAGLYDVSQETQQHSDGAMYSDDFADYRFSFALNANSGEQIQKDGWEPWSITNSEVATLKRDDGYIVEYKIPFQSVRPLSKETFVPVMGMFIPLKIDINDNDGPDDPYGDSRTMTLHIGGVDNDQNWKRPFTWGWALIGGTTDVETNKAMAPFSTQLHRNYPNPFNPSTTIQFDLGADSPVQLIVYDVLGRHIHTLLDSHLKAGVHRSVWNANNDNGKMVSVGIYFVKLISGNDSFVQKITLVK
jgi:hypothetical protein